MYQKKIFSAAATLLTLAMILSIGLACGTTPTIAPLPVEIPSNYSTYTDESKTFSISYPADWETALMLIPALEQSAKQAAASLKSGAPVEKTSFVFLGGKRTSTGYEPNLNIVLEPVPARASTLEQTVEAEVEGARKELADYRELSRVKTTVDGREAIILEWEGTPPDTDKLHFLQMYTVADKNVWVVTCTSLTADFAQWKSDFNIILGSLRISK